VRSRREAGFCDGAARHDVAKKGGSGGGTAVAAPPQAAIEHAPSFIRPITSCTNTSNPSVMSARASSRRGRREGPHAEAVGEDEPAPGSKVVTDYLKKAGLDTYLDKLGFNLVGYGCTTCIGNSGPLPDDVSAAIDADGLFVASVLSAS